MKIALAFAAFIVGMTAFIYTSPVMANGTKYLCWDGTYTYDPGACPTATQTQIDNRSQAEAVAKANAEATANAGAIATGGSASSTGGTATATGGRGGNATAAGGRGGNGTSFARTGNVTVNSDNRAAASAAYAAALPGYGQGNCFGDINPSGQLSLAWTSLIASGSATASKASNICAVVALAGPAAGLAYLQRMDRNVPRPLTVSQPTGRVFCDDPRYPTLGADGWCR